MTPHCTHPSAPLLCSLAAALLFTSCAAPQERPSNDERPPRANIPVGDFDSDTLSPWTPSGPAFTSSPASGQSLTALEIENAVGRGVASSEKTGDAPHGSLVSPPFIIQRDFIAFRIGGGDYEYATCANLIIDGRIVRSQTGWRSDFLTPASWDVREFNNRSAHIELVDLSSSDWGHVNVDHIIQTDAPKRAPTSTPPLYHESLRPQFHFTARQWTSTRLNPGMQQEGWINDLNGLIFYDNEYHLFAQRWAKCWLHAVSKDLVHWTELPPAFWEESQGSGVQSGSIVVDTNNTSGLGSTTNPPMVAFWSRFDNRSQCLSVSLDHGRTWSHFPRNPIFIHAERDPKVFWHEPTKRWVMMMYGDSQYHILTSPNLLEWKDEHHPLPDCFECPDLFELHVDNDANRSKWVMIQGSGKYSLGTFDGTRFVEESPRLACDLGPNFYATQTWNTTDTRETRRIQAAWMHGGVYPDMPFNQQVSFPCELTLRTTPAGIRLFREPIREIESLQGTPDLWAPRVLRDKATLQLEPSGDCYRMVAELTIPDHARATFNIRGANVTLTRNTIESSDAKGTLVTELRRIEILVDRTSIEAFANSGELSTSRCFIPSASGLSLRVEGGDVTLNSLTIWPLRSAWTAQ